MFYVACYVFKMLISDCPFCPVKDVTLPGIYMMCFEYILKRLWKQLHSAFFYCLILICWTSDINMYLLFPAFHPSLLPALILMASGCWRSWWARWGTCRWIKQSWAAWEPSSSSTQVRPQSYTFGSRSFMLEMFRYHFLQYRYFQFWYLLIPVF